MFRSIVVLFILFLSFSSVAQTTGSFQEEITFDEPDYSFTRTLYYFVPSDYDASQSYKLVVGFRGGPNTNAGQFRDQLIFLSDELNAIILCPENIDHFWNEEGLTKQLFQYSMEEAMAVYNIDPDYIYLTGLSFGGRHSVIVSMDTDDGAIPNLRGVIPFATGAEGDLQPNYDSIDEIAPACICIGLDDSNTFIAVANNLHTDIQSNGGTSMLNEIPNVGHTVDFPGFEEEMMECFDFIENSYVSAIEETTAEIEVTVFPNPASNFINLTVPNNHLPVAIQIQDIQGKVVLVVDSKDRKIDVKSLTSGNYNLVIQFEDQIVNRQINIE